MKQRIIIHCTVASCLYGVIYTLLLAFGTDLTSGFSTIGSVWLRYLLALLPLGFCVVAALALPNEGHFRARLGAHSLMVVRIICGLAHLAAGIFMLRALFSPTRVFADWCAPFFCLFGIYLLASLARLSPNVHVWGTLCGCAAYILHTLAQFITQPSSLYRIMPTASLFSGMSCMLFCCLLAESFFGATNGTAPLRRTVRAGLLCFCLATCVGFPQSLILYFNEQSNIAQLFLGIAAGALGVWGLCTALLLQKTDDTGPMPISSEFKPLSF